jgi:phosphohistidine phosphatase SixA
VHGQAQARAIGTWLAEQGAEPDAVLCSPARRAQMTADAVCVALRTRTPRFLPAIYRGTPGELLSLVETHAPDARQVLLVGHNPGMEQLLALLTEGRSAGARGMAPAALAWIELADDALEPGHGRLRVLWSP